MLKDRMNERQVDCHLVLPVIHIRNAAEHTIRTFKKHFKSGLVTTNESFPTHIRCRLLPQECTTLNIIRNSRINPKMSAEAQLNVSFYYNRTPLAPTGTKAIIRENPGSRVTWDLQGTKGWYIFGAI